MVRLSDLIMSDEKFAAMTEEERLQAIRDGELNNEQMARVMKEGSESEKAAVVECMNQASQRQDQFRGKMSGIVGGLPNAFSEFEKMRSAIFEPPEFNLPHVLLPQPPSASEVNSYASAGVLIERLKQRYKLWSEQLPEDVQPALYAILVNGVTIKALSFEKEGHNGIAIYGEINGMPGTCLVITHQAGLQIFCVAEKLEEKTERRTIGFITAEAV